MSAFADHPFRLLLARVAETGGMETDDALAAVLPLMRQVLAVHEAGRVAPLRGVAALQVSARGELSFDPAQATPPQTNARKVEALQVPVSAAVEVVGSYRQTTDLDSAHTESSDLSVSATGEGFTEPVYLPGYVSWEHAIGHHDALTDIFSLGLLLASVACGLDFTGPAELEQFSVRRRNLFALNSRLNPVVAGAIAEMTELNRHRRAQDLASLIRRLQNYREQVLDADVAFDRIAGFRESPVSGKRRLIQARLRDRLFEISRRNRLIYFRPSLHMLNLTVGSVPLVLDYRNIRLEQLFVWHPELAAAITEGAPMPLGKYLRYEDSPYLAGSLDGIINEARRDRAEFGFAQLRLVLAFLRWHNLKEAPTERIHSPLLLLPVELTKKKGVRDSYVLDPTASVAEVNPALRFHLKQLYNLDLPESVDLRETPLAQFHEQLRAQIQATEPGVTLRLVERPQIELIQARAKQRVDQYRKRLKVRTRSTQKREPADYSYQRENFRPQGLQLFRQKVLPTPMPLRDVAGAAPTPRAPNIVEPLLPRGEGKVLETSREMFALREGENSPDANPYLWDFDLCSLTLGNFNYRKMTLVRDYANLMETDLGSASFDTIFSLTPKAPEEAAPATPELADQHPVVLCDATQTSAIARARTGRSYIIQGPPGTGKSQTITNLIADYVARGQRVLFVCEKRAAIDVVFHRLRQQGLDELCCLIHDSQTDKKAFIQNLKQTYEKFLSLAGQEDHAERDRTAMLKAMEQELAGLRRFSESMRQVHEIAGLPLRSLLRRLVELRSHTVELSAAQEELLPDYQGWLRHGDILRRLATALTDLGVEPCFARHPLRLLSPQVVQADRPLEMLSTLLDDAEERLAAVESALELSGLPAELWDTFEEIGTILEFALAVLPLAEGNLLGLLDPKTPTATTFAALGKEFDERVRAHQQACARTTGWREKLSPEDTDNALAQARGFEHSFFRFLSPAFWRLRKALRLRYDFSTHAVEPSWVKLLEDLAAEHRAAAACGLMREQFRRELGIADFEGTRALKDALLARPDQAHPSVRALTARLVSDEAGSELVRSLAALHGEFARLQETLAALLAEFDSFDFPALTTALDSLRAETATLPELLPVLTDLAEVPEAFRRAVCQTPLHVEPFEAATGRKSLNHLYRLDRHLGRFDGRLLTQKLDRLASQQHGWLAQNAACIRARVRRQFLEHVNVSSLPASQLTPEQKAFKKEYAAGRRDLEHEFGKTMRYKSIRDLAAGETGRVIQDLKPIWLMSPLSVSDTLPLDPDLFDVVIFDEASQIPMEEAIPAAYRSQQVIVVGDEMQLPPTTFFASGRGEDEAVVVEEEGERIEVDLDADSFLTQSAQNLPSTLLAWHYRSRYEALISFSNAAFYGGQLYTIPDRKLPPAQLAELRVTDAAQAAAHTDALLARSISFHFLEQGLYAERCNPAEAAYIAQLVRELLARDTKLSLGIVAFSEAQQSEIEGALGRLAEEDAEFATRLEAEYTREENDQFCGLIVKNLENIQGDERDVIILSICYGPDANGRMLMNFGPINQRGGEKRLNVIFSRARHHMAIVSSIRHHAITNDYNDGANSLKNFLHYAEAVSLGDHASARRVLENLNPLNRKTLAPAAERDAVIEELARALRARGHAVDLHVGQSKFRCDLAVRDAADGFYRLGLLVDTDAHYANPDLVERYLTQPGILRAFGWRIALVLTKDWYHEPEAVVARIERLLAGDAAASEAVEAAIEELIEPEVSVAASVQNSSASQPFSSTTVPPPALPAAAGPVDSETRRFEFVGGGSSKFWEVTLSGPTFTVRFGKIGTPGQSQSKSFANATKARSEMEKLIAEKVKKGYAERAG